MKPDSKKFSLIEMCYDSKGRPSPGKFLSLLGGFVSILTFLIASMAVLFVSFGVSKESDIHASNLAQNIAMHSLAMFTLCVAHLTARRFSQDKPLENIQEKSNFGITGIGNEAR